MISTDLSKEDLEARYQDAGSLTDAAKLLKVSSTTFRRWLIEAGVKLNPRALSKNRRELVKPTDDKLCSLYSECGSVHSLSLMLDISDYILTAWLKDAGVDLSRGYHSPKKVRHYAEDHHNWKGGIQHHSSGYVMIYNPAHPDAPANKGYVMEHRLVMEERLGRYLTDSEVVHHINGERVDNRLENLVVLTRKTHIQSHKANANRDSEGRFVSSDV